MKWAYTIAGPMCWWADYLQYLHVLFTAAAAAAAAYHGDDKQGVSLYARLGRVRFAQLIRSTSR